MADQHQPLLPCPFCGGSPETDYNRHFYDYRGRMGKAVAIYCANNSPPCHCDMQLCCADLPEFDEDEIMALLVEAWNRRAFMPPADLAARAAWHKQKWAECLRKLTSGP